jgi:hypothetical protein
MMIGLICVLGSAIELVCSDALGGSERVEVSLYRVADVFKLPASSKTTQLTTRFPIHRIIWRS